VDYWTPQLYWPIGQIPQSYPVLLGWWARRTRGTATSGPGSTSGASAGPRGGGGRRSDHGDRGMVADAPGNVHWSIGALARSDTLAAAVLEGPYLRQALVPASPLARRAPPRGATVAVEQSAAGVLVRWEHPDPGDVFRWVVHFRVDDEWSYRILSRAERQVALDARPPRSRSRAVDRVGEREPVGALEGTLTPPARLVSFSGP